MRLLPLLLCLCLPLAGCVTNGVNLDAVTSDPWAATPMVRHNFDVPEEKPKSSKEHNENWWKEGGVTREKVSAMCWMKYEKGRRGLNLDKRADLVNKCIDDTLKEYPVR